MNNFSHFWQQLAYVASGGRTEGEKKRKSIGVLHYRKTLVALIVIALLISHFGFLAIIDANAAVTIPTGAVTGAAKNAFLSNKGQFSDWQKPKSGFTVDDAYAYRLAATSSTSYQIIGKQSYDAGLKIAEGKNFLTTTVRNSAIFSLKSGSSSKPGNIGMTAKNLRIWNSATKKYDFVDMKVTVRSWEIDAGTNNFIFIHKSPRTTVYISGLIEAKVRFEYFVAGTSTKYKMKGNMSIADIDDYQYVGFAPEKTINQYVASNSLLNFASSNGQFIYYRNGGPDSTGTPRLAAGITYETNTLDIVFGDAMARKNKNQWAMFSQYANSMGPIELPDPYKTVSDNDEKDLTLATLKDPEEHFTYKVIQRIPAGMSEEMYYKSFTMEDQIDSCLKIEKIKVLQGTGTDRSTWFDISSTGNKVIAKAVASALKNVQFYGGTTKDDTVFSLEIECVINPNKTYEDLKGHGHVLADKSMNFANKGTVKINSSSKTTNEVVAKLKPPVLEIDKSANRYEYQVGEPVEYTIKVSHSKASPVNATRLVVKDVDLPEGMVIDEKTLAVSGIKGKSSISPEKGGFVLNADRLDLGEECKIKFTATPTKDLNGTITVNTGSAIAFMVPEIIDDASVYVNSPKLDIIKTSDKSAVSVGDMVTYELTVSQINPGTFMRDVIIEDKMPADSVKLHSGSIQVIDSNGELITNDCDIVTSGNAFTIKTQKDLAHKNLSIPPKDKDLDPYKKLKPESVITVIYDVSILDGFEKTATMKNVAVTPATPNTNGDLIKDDPQIPSGGDTDENEIGAIISTQEEYLGEPAKSEEKSEPEKPEEKDKPEKAKKSPKTGDAINIILLAIVLGISGAISCVLIIIRKRMQ